MRRLSKYVALVTIASAIVAAPLGAAGRFPEKIALPDGFQPEGIAIGKGARFYVGSIPTGAIYRGDLRTGEGAVFIPGAPGRRAAGVELAGGRLFVAGGPTGKGFVYSARTGELLLERQLAASPIDMANPTFVNDVVVARGGAYFTDSQRPFLYRLGLDGTVERIPLTGDIVYTAGFNVNGIDTTRNRKTLIIVQSNTGKVFTVNRQTGVAREIKLNEAVMRGDGILLDGGRTLYVVQNQDNKVAVIRLDRGLTSGTVVRHLTDSDFDVPTTIDEFGKRLYAVNARFTTPPTATTDYWVAQFRKAKRGG
jgi:sugar lactone lactonase YvrE